ncbi:MAG: hypothetical protein WC916_03685 [Candidatus Woesearchaeota archaeon]
MAGLFTPTLTNGTVDPANIAMFMLLFGIMILIAIAVYIYMSFAYMRLGQRTKVKSPGLAWIPGFGPAIIAYKSSKMDARPWWMLLWGVVAFFVGMIFLLLGKLISSASLAFYIIGGIILLAAAILGVYYSVYMYIWSWKLFKKVGRAGWWALIPLFSLPFILVGLTTGDYTISLIIEYAIYAWFLVMVGIAAWGNPQKR